VRRLKLLDREEEAALAGQISRRRSAIVRLLREYRPVVERALRGAGKGALDPETAFREREALRILAFARRRGATRDLAERLERELLAYRDLRDRMIAANLRLVTSLARRHRHPTLSELDFIQEGTLGLIRAIERYEPARGIRFSTYAVWWIWQQVARAADNQGALIRTPVHWNQFRRKAARAGRGGWGGLPEEALRQLAEETGVAAEYARAMEQGVRCVSLDASPADDGGPFQTPPPTADPRLDPAVINEERDLGARLATALASLPPREQEVLRLRFGLAQPPLTLQEIGARYGVSRERIRQIETRAMAHLRDVCLDRGLQEYLQ
jgi:RNA polymerase sigma factor (sigma-70 family)